MDADTVACQKIINAETPFECFELPTEEVDPELVRSLYLKIAVRIHPDKNKSDLATQAFQILSESFEELHDEYKQTQLLRKTSQSIHPHQKHTRRKRKKRKPQDIADLVHQTDKWYTKDWKDVEEEISRMTNEFKEHLARKQEKHEKQLEKKSERRERKNKRIKKNLNFLYEKYGIDPSDSDSDSDKNTYNYVAYVPEVQAIADTVEPTPSEPSSEVASTSASSKESVCWVCRRSFQSEDMLKIHYEKSELHRTNVEKANNPSLRFKNSFSEVKDT
ncbi:myosin-M heavy chain-like isoform X1 [Bolinopsis microptera]|uniref:myosin-M heavy chain-like isoform X1 n=1 Tax=Bolinopsis microptera TaxID=2820187 RepID=UPI0030790BE5